MSQRLHRREPSGTAAGDPVVTGVIDFQRASFDDPMADLAKRFATPPSISQAAPGELAAAYGVDAADQERLAVHDLSTPLPNGCGSAPTSPPVGAVRSGS